MSKKPEGVKDLNDKAQLDLFGGEDVPVSDEIKKAIDVFKNPPDHSLNNDSDSKKAPPEHFISRSRILKHRSNPPSDLGLALELIVTDGEAIIDDGLNPSEIDNWLPATKFPHNVHIFDTTIAEPFSESNKEILNVQDTISNDGRSVSPWANLVFHRDNIKKINEHEYRGNAQIFDRFWDDDPIPKIPHQLYITDEPALIDVIIKIKPGGKSIERSWNECIDKNKVEIRFEIGSDYKYNKNLSYSEAFHQFRTKKYRIDSKKYSKIEIYMDHIGMGIAGLEYSKPHDIDYIKIGNEMITHIAIPIYNKESKFNYKMIPFRVGSKLSKNHLYHLTGSIFNQIKFQQNFWGIDQGYIEMLKEDGDNYYSDYELLKPLTGKALEAFFPRIIKNIEDQCSHFGKKTSRPASHVSINYWMGIPVFSGIKTDRR